MKIYHDGKELLESKSFIVYEGGETSFELSYKGETITLILEFIDDKQKKQNISFNVLESGGTKGKLILTNFNSPLGTGFSKLQKAGTIGGRELWLTILINQIGSIKHVVISFYLGEEVQHG